MIHSLLVDPLFVVLVMVAIEDHLVFARFPSVDAFPRFPCRCSEFDEAVQAVSNASVEAELDLLLCDLRMGDFKPRFPRQVDTRRFELPLDMRPDQFNWVAFGVVSRQISQSDASQFALPGELREVFDIRPDVFE